MFYTQRKNKKVIYWIYINLLFLMTEWEIFMHLLSKYQRLKSITRAFLNMVIITGLDAPNLTLCHKTDDVSRSPNSAFVLSMTLNYKKMISSQILAISLQCKLYSSNLFSCLFLVPNMPLGSDAPHSIKKDPHSIWYRLHSLPLSPLFTTSCQLLWCCYTNPTLFFKKRSNGLYNTPNSIPAEAFLNIGLLRPFIWV